MEVVVVHGKEDHGVDDDKGEEMGLKDLKEESQAPGEPTLGAELDHITGIGHAAHVTLSLRGMRGMG